MSPAAAGGKPATAPGASHYQQPGSDAGGSPPTPPPGGPSAGVRLGVVVALVIVAVTGIYLYRRPAQESAPATPAPRQVAPETATQDEDASATTAPPAELAQDAQQYVDDLTSRQDGSVPAEELSGFVTPEQKLRLREGEAGYVEEQVSALDPDAEVAVVRNEPQVEYRTLRQLAQEHGDNPAAMITLLDDTGLVEVSLGELTQRHADNPDRPLAVVVQSEYIEQTTAAELQAAGEQTARVLRDRFLPRETTLRELFGGKISIREGTVFYVRAVDEGDFQGIWGIIHSGLIDEFARGIALQRGEDITRYQVDIPHLADERMPDSTSSFLGRIIDTKVRESHTFSLRDGRIGQDPNLVRPGEELLLVDFTEDELVSIYEHFVNRASDGS